MALITCPECKKAVSSLAKACPNCGCPLEEMQTGGIVKIKLPNLELGTVGLFSSRRATIENEDGDILWEGEHGQTATFKIAASEVIIINMGKWANSIEGKVYPRKKYSCVQDMGIHWKATYRLSEVDVIDAD